MRRVAIREIIEDNTGELNLKLPQEFRNKKIEVIIFPYDEEECEENKEKIIEIFEGFRGVLPVGYKFDRNFHL